MLGQICHDCDDLNLEAKPTTLPNSDEGQLGLFSKTLFLPRQLICEARGPMLKRAHLEKLLLLPNDVLVGTYDDHLIHCKNICRFAQDLIVKPRTLQEFKLINPKNYRPFKMLPGTRYNARFVMRNHTQNKVFLEAIAPIQPGSQIFVRHDTDVTYQQLKCQFLHEKEMNELAAQFQNM